MDQATISSQRQLTVKITTPDGASTDIAELTVRIPDDLDIATLDQVAAKIIRDAAGTIDSAIAAGTRVEVAKKLVDAIAALTPKDAEPEQPGTDEPAKPADSWADAIGRSEPEPATV